jgi:hypothetical protein
MKKKSEAFDAANFTTSIARNFFQKNLLFATAWTLAHYNPYIIILLFGDLFKIFCQKCVLN